MRSLTLVLFFFLLSFHSVFASPQFNRCKNILRVLSNPETDTSVELEIKNSDPILSLLTTEDGTLAPLLPKKSPLFKLGYVLPPELAGAFTGWSYEKLAEEPWDNLTPQLKRHFLSWITLRKRTDFFSDRKIPEIKIKDKTRLFFSEPTVFLGETYPAGSHEIDISHLFRQVEYGSPSQNPSHLELHFRAKHPAGAVSNSAWTFLAGLATPKIHQHVHIVAPLNIERLQKEGRVRSVMLADFFRIANLVAEMLAIVEEKFYGIKATKQEHITFWDTLSPAKLNQVLNHLEATRTTGRQPPLMSETKMAFIGFRGADTYDDPSLIGFEIRSISRTANADTTKNFLNTLQWSLNQENYGVSQDKMTQWIDQNPILNFGNTYYNQSWDSLKGSEASQRFEEIDPYLRRLFYDLEKNRELKMLIYDWSNDPLLFDKPKLLKQIHEEQLKAIERLKSGTEPQQLIMSQFLVRSGLYGIFTRSLGQ